MDGREPPEGPPGPPEDEIPRELHIVDDPEIEDVVPFGAGLASIRPRNMAETSSVLKSKIRGRIVIETSTLTFDRGLTALIEQKTTSSRKATLTKEGDDLIVEFTVALNDDESMKIVQDFADQLAALVNGSVVVAGIVEPPPEPPEPPLPEPIDFPNMPA